MEDNKCYGRSKCRCLWKHRLWKMVVREGLAPACVELCPVINPKPCGAGLDTHQGS